MNTKVKQACYLALCLLFSSSVKAQFSTIEVGEATLPANAAPASFAQTPFTRIDFAAPFAQGVTPNVFTMTPEFGAGADDDPCLVRIRNISNTGFDAACLEPRNEDRASPGATFEYIAIVNGTTTVPTTAGGSVVFESQCAFVNRQVSGPACDNCATTPGIPTGFQQIDFVNNFNNAPALLTELVTTNNALSGGAGVPGGEPEFLSAAVRGLNSNDFDISLDRLEAGNGSLFSGESVCYLAVERQACQTLDLSGISGSVSSVNFEAVFGGNVDGHNNGASSGEGASFASGCFSGTPVAVADMRTRNGNNGGFVRQANINASEIILTIDEDRVSDNERSHIDEQVSVLAFGQTFTTPVTLNQVHIRQLGRRLRFDWQTSAESFHLGFHLWGETDTGWVQLNQRLIPGQGTNTDVKSDYAHSIRLTRQQFNQVRRFGISTIDTVGFEEFYGPFEAGQEYGEQDTTEAIDWTQTREEFDRRMQARGFINVDGRWRRDSRRLQRRLERREQRVARQSLELSFEGHGVRKVTGAEILAVQPAWRGLALNRLALTLNGKAVARHIVSRDHRLSSDDILLLNAAKPQGVDALYLDSYTYRLSGDINKVLVAEVYDAQPLDELTLSNTGLVEYSVTQDQRYSAAISSGDPWYDADLLTTGGAVSKSYPVILPASLRADQEAILDLSLFGSIDLPDDVPDHHVQVRVNGVLVHDVRFDGLVEHSAQVRLAAGLLTVDSNEITITLPGDTGLFADLVLVDEISVLAPIDLSSPDAESATVFVANNDASGYRFSGVNSADHSVYAFTSSGAFSIISAEKSASGLGFAALPFISSSNKPEKLNYAVLSTPTIEGPRSINPVEALSLHQQANDFLIVAHPSFIGDELNDYIEFKREEGFTPTLISWLDVVEGYGFGNNTPQALDNFLMRAGRFYQPENILVVGGHTYDYLDVLGSGAVNFIPTHYRRVGIFEYAPTDNVFADLDNDNLPELAIGRWPVRSKADLKAIISKSKTWQENRANSNNQDALLIAQSNDGRNLNFEQSLDGRVAPQLAALSQFSEPARVYLNQLSGDVDRGPIQQARDMIAERINAGSELISFAGHASSSGWGFQGIVNTQFIKDLNNHAKPSIVMPLACYTSNYQSLSTNTLAHQWLFAGTQGAAAVHGAAMLGEYRENGIFAERVLRQSQTTKRLGQAIKQAKLQMTSGNEMLHNWALLGDPTLNLR